MAGRPGSVLDASQLRFARHLPRSDGRCRGFVGITYIVVWQGVAPGWHAIKLSSLLLHGTALKHLTIVRHAKSSWKFPELPDHDRPLNPRGERDAPNMGKRLAEKDGCPDLVISSPAVRALTTAKVIAAAIGYPEKDIVVDGRMYGAGASRLISLIRKVDDSNDRVAVFGHNPAVTDLVNRLSDFSLANLPTCGVAELRFAMDSWVELGESPAVEVEIDYPKKGTKSP